jgi:hypothetical protein
MLFYDVLLDGCKLTVVFKIGKEFTMAAEPEIA